MWTSTPDNAEELYDWFETSNIIKQFELPSITSELEVSPHAHRLGETCRHCGGEVWSTNNSVICESCSTIIEPRRQSLSDTLWADFWSDRPRHWNSKLPRCVGGFPEPYEWVDSDDIARAMRGVSMNDNSE